MLCEISLWGNFVITWVLISLIGFAMIMLMSGLLFYRYYIRPTFADWRYKSNPKYPSAQMVRNEIIQMIKGMWTATFCPALSLYLAQKGLSKAYCGSGPNGEFGWLYHIVTFLFCWISCDFWEFYYHRLGHTTESGWKQHKWHHLFYNPSPFAVIADEYVDQFFRSLPLVLFPLLMPINIDMMFFQFGLFFYGYGAYLHWGYELEYPNAHHPFLNTSFQHYLHHAVSIHKRPYSTGFFFKIWDELFGSVYKGKCFCSKCEREKGQRTVDQWNQILKEKPDYSLLLRLNFWMDAFNPQSDTKLKLDDSSQIGNRSLLNDIDSSSSD